MSESELVEATNSYYELLVAMISLYMTFTSGYLIVAYMAGSRISRSQTNGMVAPSHTGIQVPKWRM